MLNALLNIIGYLGTQDEDPFEDNFASEDDRTAGLIAGSLWGTVFLVNILMWSKSVESAKYKRAYKKTSNQY